MFLGLGCRSLLPGSASLYPGEDRAARALHVGVREKEPCLQADARQPQSPLSPMSLCSEQPGQLDREWRVVTRTHQGVSPSSLCHEKWHEEVSSAAAPAAPRELREEMGESATEDHLDAAEGAWTGSFTQFSGLIFQRFKANVAWMHSGPSHPFSKVLIICAISRG